MERLISGAAVLGLTLTENQVAAFQRYAELLQEWNERFNLTAITDLEGIQTHHFLDSISLLPALAAATRRTVPQIIEQTWRSADVGPGAGFPGLALKILWPNLRLSLIEATEKKVGFMRNVSAELGLEGVEFVHARVEDAAKLPAHREAFDLVLARAVAPLATLVEYLLPLARVGSRVVAYKGPGAEAEAGAVRTGLRLLGGRLTDVLPVNVPGMTEARTLVMIEKIQPTPRQYPRANGLPRKRPL